MSEFWVMHTSLAVRAQNTLKMIAVLKHNNIKQCAALFSPRGLTFLALANLLQYDYYKKYIITKCKKAINTNRHQIGYTVLSLHSRVGGEREMAAPP